MTQSPSPSVDEVEDMAATLRRDAAYILAKKQPAEVKDAPRLAAFLERVAAKLLELSSIVSPPKAGSGEPVAWMIPDWGTVYGKAGFRYLTNEQTSTSRDDWEDGEYDAFRAAMKGAVPLYANHEARGDGVRGTDDDGEAEILAEQSAENMRLIDWIADQIGLPHDEELSRSNFTAWREAALPPLGDGRAEIVEEIAKLAESKAAAQSEFQKSAYSRGDDIGGHGHWKAQCELLTLAAAIRAISSPPKSSETPGNAGVST